MKSFKIGDNYTIYEDGTVVNHITGQKLQISKEPSGYTAVSLRINGKYVRKRMHQWLAIAFIPNPDGLPQINHIDGNKSNNSLSNLEWCTAKHNIRHSFDTGLCVRPKGKDSHMFGSRNKQSKRIVDDSTGIVYHCIREAAQAAGIPRTTLNAALTGRRPNPTTMRYEDHAKGLHMHDCLVGDKFFGKVILNTTTGIYYGNVCDAARSINIPHSTLSGKLRGKRTNNTSFVYV